MRTTNRINGKHLAVTLGCLALAVAVSAGRVWPQAAPGKGSVMTVRVLQAKVMKKPQFIGAAVGTVSRGDRVTFVSASGAWYQVTGAASGWLHKTNLIAGQVSLSSKPGGGGGGTVSRDEVELAGRGFTPEVESQYRQKNPTLDFHHVDLIEHAEVDPVALEEFVRQGQLPGAAGGTP